MKAGFKKKLGLFSLCLMAMLTVFMLRPAQADAAVTKVKKQSFTTSPSVANKKATKIKKGKTYTLQFSPEGFVKFTAPKTKTYKFTFSNLKSVGKSGSDINHSYITFYMNKYGTSLSGVTSVKTKGGTTSTLWVCTKYSYSLSRVSTVRTGTSLPTRTGSVKLAKGQTIYLYFHSQYTSRVNLKVK